MLQLSKNNNYGVLRALQRPDSSAVPMFQDSINSDPISYVGYYNLFVLHCRCENHEQEALQNLICAICCLYVKKALLHKSEKVTKDVFKIINSYCLNSPELHLVRSVLYFQSQKYVLCVNEINMAIDLSQDVKIRQKYLNLNKMIMEMLEREDKAAELKIQIQKLSQQCSEIQSKQGVLPNLRLRSLYKIETDKSVDLVIGEKLDEFKQLFMEVEVPNLSKSTQTNNAIFKRVEKSEKFPQSCSRQCLVEQLQKLISENDNNAEINRRSNPRSSRQSVSSRKSDLLYDPLRSKKDLKNQFKEQQSKQKSSQQQTKSFTQSSLNHTTLNQSLGDNQESINRTALNLSTGAIDRKKKVKKNQMLYPFSDPGQQIEVKLQNAHLTNNKELIGNMDPYCTLQYNGQLKQSSVKKSGGLEPLWKESFAFDLTPQASLLKIKVYDKERFKSDDFVGEAGHRIEKNGFFKIDLFEGNLHAGFVFITVDSKIKSGLFQK